MASFFQNLPWLNNVQNVADAVVDDIAHAAEGVAESFGFRRDRMQQQQQQQQWRNQARQQQQAAQHAVNPNRIPPASARAIRQLPTIAVAPEDLVDENNRECCICMEPNCLGDKVMRMPCAHIFHSDCIVDWLKHHHCTCPICRYELATDDPMYEAGRAQRMKARKPRFARYELDRMSIRELVELNRGGPSMGIGEKKDLIQYLIDAGHIDLIPAPEPVEFKLEVLEAMKIRELKKTMEEAGVFYDEKDVIEKKDMISIFVNSGRLNLIDDSKTDGMEEDQNEMLHAYATTISNPDGDSKDVASKVSLPSKRTLVETVDECSDDEGEKRPSNGVKGGTPVVMFPTVSSPVQERSDIRSQDDVQHTWSASESSWSMPASAMSEQQPQMASTPSPDNATQSSNHANSVSSQPPSQQDTSSSDTILSELVVAVNPSSASPGAQSDDDNMSIDENAEIPQQENLMSSSPAVVANPSVANPGARSDNGENLEIHQEQNLPSSSPDYAQASLPQDSRNPPEGGSSTMETLSEEPASTSGQMVAEEQSSVTATDASASMPRAVCSISDNTTTTTHSHVSDCPLSEYSIAQLLRLGREAGIDLASCFERSEMVHRLVSAGVTGRSRVDLQPSHFRDWSISQLRAVASEVNIDLSDCSDQTEIVERMVHQANTERPHLRNYLRVLAPLATSSLSQLRATARGWDVDISDCLEKDEIIQRLITRANQFGIC